jgi:hypothetical protein
MYLSGLPAKITMSLGAGWVSNKLRALAMHLVSPLKPTPIIRPTNHAWSALNTSFAAQHLMLAATAHGLRTIALEGFDERRLSAILGISLDSYSIPLMVCMGHSANPADVLPALALQGQGTPLSSSCNSNSNSVAGGDGGKEKTTTDHPKKVRFPLEEICFSERFGQPVQF